MFDELLSRIELLWVAGDTGLLAGRQGLELDPPPAAPYRNARHLLER